MQRCVEVLQFQRYEGVAVGDFVEGHVFGGGGAGRETTGRD